MNNNLDPIIRLASAKREFGEWGGVNLSTENSVTYSVLSADTLPAIFSGARGPDNGGCYLYGRSLNPTVRVLSRMIAAIEGTEAAYCCASGMAAISASILNICNSGDHIVCSNAIYGGTYALFKDFFPKKNNIHTTFVPIDDLGAVENAITAHTKVIYCETISNPTLVVADIPSLAQLAHARGILLVVDNTFSPMIVCPAQHGADVVVHSLTKFISGAADAIAGAVCGSRTFISGLMDLHMGPLMLLGGVMDPKVASDIALRIPHLSLRMIEHSKRAALYASHLQSLGAKVTYPGLLNHPQHHILKRLSNEGYGYGGLLTIELPSLPAANAFMERLQNVHSFGILAVSLGYFDTLMSASASSTSSEMSSVDLQTAGIQPGLVRMSVGITGTIEMRLQQLEETWLFIQNAIAQMASPSRGLVVGLLSNDALLTCCAPTPIMETIDLLKRAHIKDDQLSVETGVALNEQKQEHRGFQHSSAGSDMSAETPRINSMTGGFETNQEGSDGAVNEEGDVGEQDGKTVSFQTMSFNRRWM